MRGLPGLLVVDFDDDATLVATATRTHAVRKLRRFALGALREARSGEMIVRAATVALRF